MQNHFTKPFEIKIKIIKLGHQFLELDGYKLEYIA